MAIKIQQYIGISAEDMKTSFEELAETYPDGFKQVEIIKDSGFYDMFIVYDDGTAAAAATAAKVTTKNGGA